MSCSGMNPLATVSKSGVGSTLITLIRRRAKVTRSWVPIRNVGVDAGVDDDGGVDVNAGVDMGVYVGVGVDARAGAGGRREGQDQGSLKMNFLS